MIAASTTKRMLGISLYKSLLVRSSEASSIFFPFLPSIWCFYIVIIIWLNPNPDRRKRDILIPGRWDSLSMSPSLEGESFQPNNTLTARPQIRFAKILDDDLPVLSINSQVPISAPRELLLNLLPFTKQHGSLASKAHEGRGSFMKLLATSNHWYSRLKQERVSRL